MQISRNDYEAIREFLSFPETLALLCFNMNYNYSFVRIDMWKLSSLLNIHSEKLKKICKVMSRIKILKMHEHGEHTQIEMLAVEEDELKDLIFDAIWSNRELYFEIYRGLIKIDPGHYISIN